MNKEYCDFCGDETLHWKQGGNEVNYGGIGNKTISMPYKTACDACLAIWNELTVKVVEEVKHRRVIQKARIGIAPLIDPQISVETEREYRPNIIGRFWAWMQT